MDEARFAVLKAELAEFQREIGYVYGQIDRRRATFRETAEGIDSMAYQLHNLYCACEQLFEAVARFFENWIEADRYHTDLLRRMKLEIEGIRPALVSGAAFEMLDELRRFRHFFRHAYLAELKSENVYELVDTAERLREAFRKDLETFLARLASQ